MKIAIVGLGKMGMQIARKLAEDGHDVVAHNRSSEPVDEAVTYGAKAAYKKEDVVKAFDGEQLVLWLMIPAEVIEAELDHWLNAQPWEPLTKNDARKIFITFGNWFQILLQ